MSLSILALSSNFYPTVAGVWDFKPKENRMTFLQGTNPLTLSLNPLFFLQQIIPMYFIFSVHSFLVD